MFRWIAFAVLLLSMPAQAQAQAPVASPPLPRVALTTSEGTVTVELETAKAPVTAGNFLRYVDGKRLDGTSFYRALKLTPDGAIGLIQGGTRGDAKRVLPKIAHEPTTLTGLSHADGAISMARGAPGSADGDFFIIVGGVPGLDAQPAASGDNAGFAVFGRVVDGMDVVRRILMLPTSAEGEGVMKGQMLAAPIRIVSARRIN